MNIEETTGNVIKAAVAEHRTDTEAALVELFQYQPNQAKRLVNEFWNLYKAASLQERYLLLHNDPAALATGLAGIEWRAVDKRELKKFNDGRRARLQSYSHPSSNAERPSARRVQPKKTELGRALDIHAKKLWKARADTETYRVTEHQVGEAVLRILASSRTGSMTLSKLKEMLPEYLPLSAADHGPSPTRKNEEVWEQQVRNLVSHRKMPGNIVFERYAVYEPRRLSISAAGRAHIGIRQRR